MLIGKRRDNKWSDGGCMFCGGENGGMRHVVLECEGKGIRDARERESAGADKEGGARGCVEHVGNGGEIVVYVRKRSGGM